MKMILIDYGISNLFSVKKAFERIGYSIEISNQKGDIDKADKLILPGVGHFGKGMNNLYSLDLVETIRNKVINKKTPILGICLGMQLFANYSEEGKAKGLRLINCNIKKFALDNLIIPHMGWNSIKFDNHFNLFKGIKSHQDLFYFVHTYHVVIKDDDQLSYGLTKYGYDFISTFRKENIYGVQFHPEKSHDKGLELLKNFADI